MLLWTPLEPMSVVYGQDMLKNQIMQCSSWSGQVEEPNHGYKLNRRADHPPTILDHVTDHPLTVLNHVMAILDSETRLSNGYILIGK